jgi:hypothetical protein
VKGEEGVAVRTQMGWDGNYGGRGLVLRTALVKGRRKRLQDEDAKELFLTLCLKGRSF